MAGTSLRIHSQLLLSLCDAADVLRRGEPVWRGKEMYEERFEELPLHVLDVLAGIGGLWGCALRAGPSRRES